MKKYLPRLIVLAAIAAAVVLALRFTPLGSYLNLRTLQQNRNDLIGLVRANYLLAVPVYIGLYIVVVALSIPGATILTLLGGFFFGVPLAVLYINVGATAGATLVFLAARYFLGEMIQNRYGEKLRKFNQEMESNGKSYLLFLRLVPLFPFWMINLFAGVTRIRLATFIWTTALGIIPGSAVYAYAGWAFADLGESGGIPRNIIFAFLALAALSLVPTVIRKVQAARKARRARDAGGSAAP
jgi:uncharacterized membrane protein YdjX (TVP38/TMEM64 family)